MTPVVACVWTADMLQCGSWLGCFGSNVAAIVIVESAVLEATLLKRRVPVNESVVGRDLVSFGAAAPKLCNVDSAQAAADVGEKRSPPLVPFAVTFGLGTGEDEDVFFS